MVIISGLSRMPQTKQTLNIEYGLVAECVNKCYRKTQNLFSDEISREEWMQRSFLYLKHVKNFSNCARLHKANTWFTRNACFVPWRGNRRVAAAATAAKSLQSCSTLCDPVNGSPSGSPVPGILKTRTLERVAVSFSNAWKWKVRVKSLNPIRLLATPWTTAYQAPLSMGFSRQECWSGVPLPSPTGDIDSP